MPPEDSLTRPFRNRNFVLVWTGQAVSSLGNSMYVVALAWSVYQLTGSPGRMSVVLIVNMVPRILLSMTGGALADRVSRRSMLIIGDLTACLLTGLLALLFGIGDESYWLIALTSFGLGVVSAFFDPAYRSIYRDVLSLEEQQAGISVANATSSVTSIVGPAIGGIVFAIGGAQACFLANAASFGLAGVASVLASIPREKVAYATTLTGDTLAGIALVLRTRWLRTVLSLDLLANFVCIAPLNVLLPAIVKQAGGSSALLGVTMGVQATSTAASALLVGKYGRRLPRGPATYGFIATVGVGVALLAAGDLQPLLIVVASLIVGIGFAFNTLVGVMIQEHTPPRFLARVWAAATVVSLTMMPLGYAVTGLLAEAAGVAAVLLGGGALLALITVGVALLLHGKLPGLPDHPELGVVYADGLDNGPVERPADRPVPSDELDSAGFTDGLLRPRGSGESDSQQVR